jgi:hypothetical protein
MVVERDHVHGHALKRRNDDAALGDGGRQLGAAEVAQPRPEAEVRPGRVLRLQAREATDRPDGVEVGAVEKQLARERRAAQFAEGQGQTTILPNLLPARNRS